MVEDINSTSEVTIERIRKYLKENKRFDKRKTDEFRELIIEKNISKKAEGSVRVRLGKTEVLVGVKVGTAAPYPDSPDKGNLMVTAELLPLSSPRFELGPPKFDAIELGRVIDRGIRESKIIDLEKLVIKEGEKVWNIFIDIYSINDDGNLLDAAGIGALAALKIAKLPKYDEEEEKILFSPTSQEKFLPSDFAKEVLHQEHRSTSFLQCVSPVICFQELEQSVSPKRMQKRNQHHRPAFGALFVRLL